MACVSVTLSTGRYGLFTQRGCLLWKVSDAITVREIGVLTQFPAVVIYANS